MTQLHDSRRPRRGRVLPEYTIPPDELVRHESETQEFYKRCYAVFEQVKPEIIEGHYNWFIIIEPDSGDYFIDVAEDAAVEKARHKHHRGMLGTFRLNETGACGRI